MSRASRALKLPPLFATNSGRRAKSLLGREEEKSAPAITSKSSAKRIAPRRGKFCWMQLLQLTCLPLAVGFGIFPSQRQRASEEFGLAIHSREHATVSNNVAARQTKITRASEVAVTKAHADPSSDMPATAKQTPGFQAIGLPNPRVKTSVRGWTASAGKKTVTPVYVLRRQVESVPEVGLGFVGIDEPPERNVSAPPPEDAIVRTVREIINMNEAHPDGFIAKLKRERADLEGLPFALGERCRLAEDSAQRLLWASREIRRALGRTSFGSYLSQVDVEEVFRTTVRKGASGFAVLRQIVPAEDVCYRLAAASALVTVSDPEATRLLAQMVLFDPAAEVQEAALKGLSTRPASEVTPNLALGLRYAWPPVVRNASWAVTNLKLTEVMPQLVDQLEMPAPCAPYSDPGAPEAPPKVREVVRINHHRNCLLCHAPAGRSAALTRNVPVGPIPVPGEPFPASAEIYYASGTRENAVRADVTYLRQDFSLLMPVSNPGNWPAMQRYDFIIRTRAATAEEIGSAAATNAQHREAVLFVLRELTGKDAGASAPAWRELLAVHDR